MTIACGKCGGPTVVSETRNYGPARVRRRRICHSIACGERVTTIEIPISDPSKGQQGALAIVPKRTLVELQRALEQAIAVAGDS